MGLCLEPDVAPPQAREAPPSPVGSGAAVQRYLWRSRFGAILIEVINGRSYVNGDPVDVWDARQDRP